MKNIFIVTDFSAASRNAAIYGIELAKYFTSKVYLFHAFQSPVQVPESYILYNTEDVWSNIKELLVKESEIINPDKLVDIEICGSEGAAAKAINTEAMIKNADLIICGMKSTAKGLRRVFGSTTTALTRLTEIPMLVVPEDASFKKPVNIALASDMDQETSAETVDMLKQLGEKFSSKLSVVWVVEEGLQETYTKRLQPTAILNNLKEMNPVYEFPKGSNVAQALEQYAEENSIDLMAVIPHKHSFLNRLFVESTTTHLIFHTHIPLLLLHQQKSGDTKAEAGINDFSEKH